MSQLLQTGPPPESNITRLRLKGILRCPTLADLKSIGTAKDNENYMAILLGESEKYDGLLQGIYDYVPEGLHSQRDGDDASWVIVDDGRSAWIKLT